MALPPVPPNRLTVVRKTAARVVDRVHWHRQDGGLVCSCIGSVYHEHQDLCRKVVTIKSVEEPVDQLAVEVLGEHDIVRRRLAI